MKEHLRRSEGEDVDRIDSPPVWLRHDFESEGGRPDGTHTSKKQREWVYTDIDDNQGQTAASCNV
jgi:hypothetical protein